MQTGKIIRKYRKELNMTQEEITQLIYEADEQLKNRSYEEAFQWARKQIEEYPNCTELILQLAVVFDARRLTKAIPDSEQYDDYIKDCYIRALESDNEATRNRAADSLYGFYCRKEEYEKAEECLSYFSMQNPERKRKQAVLYQKTGRIREAYKALEELLFTDYQMTSMTLQNLYLLAMQEQDMDKAQSLVEKQSQLAKLFDMGEYYEVSCRLDLATAKKDAAAVREIMEKMMDSVDHLADFQKSPLYEHIEFKELQEDFLKELKENLKTCFQDEEIETWNNNE